MGILEGVSKDLDLAVQGHIRRTVIPLTDGPTIIILIYPADKADAAAEAAIETAREAREGEIEGERGNR